MARHSHWHQIRLKKGITDKKRGKIFSRHAKLIAIAAKEGGNPDMNPSLRAAIENARLGNMPKENIERAIRKGTGEDKEGSQFFEVTYEGFGPSGVAIIVEAITDNKNRTSQTIRKIFEDYGGSLTSAGSVAYLFERKGLLRVKGKGSQGEDELSLIDCGAEDLIITPLSDGGLAYSIFTHPRELYDVKKKIEEYGFQVFSTERSLEPKNLIEVKDPGVSKKILALMEALEDEEDIARVSTNADF